MSDEKWKQIERNLAEQESFVQTIMQQREKKNKAENNANIDNILSSSIQQAKQKINTIQSKNHHRSDRSSQNLALSREKKEKNSDDNSGVAGAMKKLQEKIAILQKQNKQIAKNLKSERDRLLQAEQQYTDTVRSLEQSRRKVKNLQLTIYNDKAWIKELQKKIELLQKQSTKDRNEGKKEQLQSKISNSEMMFRAQQQELKNTLAENENKHREIKLLQEQLEDEKKRHLDENNMLKAIQKQLQLKMTNLQQRIKQKDNLIEGLRDEVKKSQIDKLKFSRALLDQPSNQQEDLQQKETVLKAEMIREDFDQLGQRYNQLMQSYRNMQQRGQKDKIDAKNYRNKFWQLKEVVKEIIDKIQSLPNAVTSQLRYLIIKANKIQAFSNDYYVSTPTKSRKNSLLNNSTSRSKQKSKKKMLKFDDLNQSKNSARSNSKRSLKSNVSSSSVKKSSSKTKQKKVVWSQKSMKSEEVTALQNEIQNIRKKYKVLLVKSQGQNGEELDQKMRDQLNELAFLLQEKSEKLTKLKRKQ